jgi:hypothetical protein
MIIIIIMTAAWTTNIILVPIHHPWPKIPDLQQQP